VNRGRAVGSWPEEVICETEIIGDQETTVVETL
jgi:hypothetical protein